MSSFEEDVSRICSSERPGTLVLMITGRGDWLWIHPGVTGDIHCECGLRVYW